MKWRKGIVAPHMRHRPRKPRYASIGMFAHHGIGRLHETQNERGVTIEISRGNRYAMTLTKLPTLAPNKNAISAPNQSGRSAMLRLHHRDHQRTIAEPVMK